jgi:hypothetical protein
MLPQRIDDRGLLLPSLAAFTQYVDWRTVTGPQANPATIARDFVPVGQTLQDAWDQTVAYLEKSWRAHLL